MDTIVSQRGKDNWIYEGYRYRRDRCNADGSSSWRCVRRDCVGRRKKLSDGSSVEVTVHIHAPDNAKNDAERVKADIRQRAVNTVERPRQIILQTTTGTSLEASQYLPAYSSLQRTVNRKRKRENLALPNLRSVQEIQIPDQLKVTTRGDSFLFWDSGEDDPQRLFVFCTDRNIDTVEQNAHWFMDGTFKVAPELFVQLFTIHALVDNRALPMVYVLLRSKTQADYERVFRKLLESRNTLSPSSILLDFEKATLQASAAVFAHVTVTGCLFHLGQSLWCRIQNEGLVNKYRDDENVRMFAKTLLALSFVPPDDVAECFDELNDNRPDELAPAYDNWEDNYTVSTKKRPPKHA